MLTLAEFLERRNPTPSGNTYDRRGATAEQTQAVQDSPDWHPGLIDANSPEGRAYFDQVPDPRQPALGSGQGVGLNRLPGLPTTPIRNPSSRLPVKGSGLDTAAIRALALTSGLTTSQSSQRPLTQQQLTEQRTARSNQQIANDRAKRMREQRKSRLPVVDARLARKMGRYV